MANIFSLHTFFIFWTYIFLCGDANSHIIFKNASSSIHTVFSAATATNLHRAAKFAGAQTSPEKQEAVFTPWTAGYSPSRSQTQRTEMHSRCITTCIFWPTLAGVISLCLLYFLFCVHSFMCWSEFYICDFWRGGLKGLSQLLRLAANLFCSPECFCLFMFH